jgi:ferredoxin
MATHDDPHSGRRDFFRDSINRMIGPLADYLSGSPSKPTSPPPGRKTAAWLRPPGAIAEGLFDATCHRCAKCITTCPADAIVAATAADGPAVGTPIIRAALRACVVCEGLQCTHVCPSGALLPVAKPADIAMGRAEVHAQRCVRTQGEACTTCTDACPMGPDALALTGSGPPLVKDACVGCGVCEERCPTDPRAITVFSGRGTSASQRSA